MFKLNLRNKIFFSYLALIIIMAGVSFQAISRLMDIDKFTEKSFGRNIQLNSAGYEILAGLELHRKAEYRLTAGYIDDADETLSRGKGIFTAALNQAQENTGSDDEIQLIGEIRKSYGKFLGHYRWLEENVDLKGSDNEEWSTNRRAFADEYEKLSQNTLALIAKNRQALVETRNEANKASQQFVASQLTIIFIVVAVSLGLSIWLTNLIVGPVEKLQVAVNEIKQGNYDVKIAAQNTDEIGTLANEFNKMTERLRAYQQLNLKKLFEEKKRTETILRSVGDCMIVIDPSFKIIMVNPTAERIFYLLPGVSYGKDFREVFNNDKLFKIISMGVKRNYASGFLPTFEWEYDRTRKHYQVKVFPVEKEDGSKLAYVILLEDITKLKELDQMKSDFISIASHELRTPLTSIIMSLGMVVDGSAGDLNDDQSELLGAANEDAQRMRVLLTNLLDISRIETGRMEMDLLPVDAKVILKNVTGTFNVQAQANDVSLVSESDGKIPKVLVDYNRILQVFNNLVGNALRYTPPGGTIKISTKRIEDYVLFSVKDTGPGIPREYQKKIFQKFVQVTNDPKRGGAGLGLALSYEIIKAHHGSIWVESELGKGARFNFTLPVAPPEDNEETTVAADMPLL